jgi:hypothetical protein
MACAEKTLPFLLRRKGPGMEDSPKKESARLSPLRLTGAGQERFFPWMSQVGDRIPSPR